ncbi:LysR family transcriptional regulator [Arthrobacter sp. PO-11]|uniref:LysR family transcriptional regulator n=2 Tax=Arthrobacter cavernae TaxID=2817681 RepID=A0A939KQB4_9MICC|nr:LysR family transcriptional regulator [Arthrobacter cavernae]
MQINQLQAFLAVAQELHFGRAAARLHIAQPPLSRTIKQLETELGTLLFERNTRSVTLTASGQALVPAAREVLDAARRAEVAVKSAAHGQVGLVRIDFAGISTHGLVARLARAIRLLHPGIRLELSSQHFGQSAMRRLEHGETDIALGRWDFAPPEISTEVVMPDSLLMALPDTHPLAGEPELSIARFKDQPFVTLPPHEGAVLDDRLRLMSRAAGFSPDLAQVAPDTQTALALVGAEVGCHLTLASVARYADSTQVAFARLTESSPDVDLRAAWRSGDNAPALHTVLAELMAFTDKEDAEDPGALHG